MLRFPYGLADFYRIATEGYLYVDRTAYIRRMEALGDSLLFIRPRRFGKSLWLQTLACYYDLRLAGEFDRLFGGLEIGRDPTPSANRYFVLQWDFSEIDPRGRVEEIAARLREHVAYRIQAFLQDYEGHLPGRVEVTENPAATLSNLLAVIRKTPHRLYLLIDEYDNFVNEVMVSDEVTYRGLVHKEGPFRQLLKSVKSAMAGRGLERVFLTGVSPIALSDVSSGFNVARNVFRHPQIHALCGFTEGELEGILNRMVGTGNLGADQASEALKVMREWYNGYRFADGVEERIYNPTSCLYFLQELQELGSHPDDLLDDNLAADRGKLAFWGRMSAGSRLLVDLVRGDGEVVVDRIEDRFTLEELAHRLESEPRFLASFLYYLGMLTDAGKTPELDRRLGIPNLAVERLFIAQLEELLLPEETHRGKVEEGVRSFLSDGEIGPLLRLLESELMPILSNRDYLRMDEQTLKMIFLTLFFDDRRYAVFSELETERGYADLCLLLRSGQRSEGGSLFDLLFELKYVPLAATQKTGEELRRLDDAELRRLPAVRSAFDEAWEQLDRYRESLDKRFGATLRLRSYAIVAVGLERLAGRSAP